MKYIQKFNFIIKNFLKTLKSIFLPKVKLTFSKIDEFMSCGLKYKFKYYYNLDEILIKEYPQAAIGKLIHSYIYRVLREDIKFDMNYALESIMQEVLEKFKDLTQQDIEFHKKNLKNMLENFYKWYLNNKSKIYAVNYNIDVRYENVILSVKCDCVLKEQEEYYI